MQSQTGLSITEALIILAIIALLFVVGVASYQDLQDWNKYAKQNNCVVIATERGSWYFLPDGKGGTSMHKHADRTTYRCEDGTTHIR